MKTLVDLHHIRITRGQKQVLKGINLSIQPQEHWVIMGPNGCGKTTLLEIISGYLWPTEGQVRLLGKKLGEVYLPDLRKKVGFAAPWLLRRLSPHIPVEDVIASGMDASVGYMDRISPALRTKIHKQLAFFESLDLQWRKFGELSSGEQLKVILARALVNQPKILILDEPFAHLDMGVRHYLYSFLEKISRKPHAPSMILVTHHLEDIRPLFTHALLLKDGQATAQGLKKEVLLPANLRKTFHAYRHP